MAKIEKYPREKESGTRKLFIYSIFSHLVGIYWIYSL